MFRRISSTADPRFAGDAYCRWDLGLALAQRTVEAAFMACALVFLAGRIRDLALAAAPGTPGEILAALALVSAFALARLPVGLLRASLDRAFGLDPRPLGSRAARAAWDHAVLIPVGVAGTLALSTALPVMGPLAWGASCLALVWLATALWIMLPRIPLLSAASLRAPAPGEIPPAAVRLMGILCPGPGGIGPDDVLVSSAFFPGLQAPFPMAGKIVVPEKALARLPPKALETLLVAAALSRFSRVGRSLTLLRIFCMALAAPTSLILLNSVGVVFGYPFETPPGLAALFWAGVWSAFWFAELSILFFRRAVSTRLYATVAAVTMDAKGLFQSIELVARGNLDPTRRSPFLDLFRPRQSPESQFEAIKATVHDMVEEAGRRKAAGRAADGKAASPEWGGGVSGGNGGTPGGRAGSAGGGSGGGGLEGGGSGGGCSEGGGTVEVGSGGGGSGGGGKVEVGSGGGGTVEVGSVGGGSGGRGIGSGERLPSGTAVGGNGGGENGKSKAGAPPGGNGAGASQDGDSEG
jgi:hypothetical protein